MKISKLWGAGLLASVALVACSDDQVDGGKGGASSGTQSTSAASMSTGGMTGSGSGNGSGSGTMASGTASTGTSGLPPDHISQCEGHTYQCGDLIDNDMDGLVDSQDPDCLGPCDNTEDSYFGGIPGQAGPACIVDCYFDFNSGSGDDDCYWNHACDPHEVAPSYYPESQNGAACKYDTNANTPGTPKTCAELNSGQSQTCHDICGPLTPNGCDCFGCCELPAGKGKFVFLGSESPKGPCDIAHIDDPEYCQPCQPVADCLNGCDPCEICIGKPLPDPGCGGNPTTTTGSFMTGSSSGGGGQQCLPDVQPCGLAGQSPCPVGYFCNTGCCTQEPS